MTYTMAFKQNMLAWQCLETFSLSQLVGEEGFATGIETSYNNRTWLTANNYSAPNDISANLEKPCYKVILSNTSGNFDAIGK